MYKIKCQSSLNFQRIDAAYAIYKNASTLLKKKNQWTQGNLMIKYKNTFYYSRIRTKVSDT